jgi:hypothetical protein
MKPIAMLALLILFPVSGDCATLERTKDRVPETVVNPDNQGGTQHTIQEPGQTPGSSRVDSPSNRIDPSNQIGSPAPSGNSKTTGDKVRRSRDR